MLTWLAADWFKSKHLRGAWLAVPAIACLIVLGVLSYRQVSYWHDTETFWLRTIALTENNYVAHDSLGNF